MSFYKYFCILIFSSSAAILLDAIMMGGSITPPAEPDLHRQHAVRYPLLWIWAYRRANIKIYPQVFGWTTNVSWEIYPWYILPFWILIFRHTCRYLYKLGMWNLKMISIYALHFHQNSHPEKCGIIWWALYIILSEWEDAV